MRKGNNVRSAWEKSDCSMFAKRRLLGMWEITLRLKIEHSKLSMIDLYQLATIFVSFWFSWKWVICCLKILRVPRYFWPIPFMLLWTNQSTKISKFRLTVFFDLLVFFIFGVVICHWKSFTILQNPTSVRMRGRWAGAIQHHIGFVTLPERNMKVD